MPFALQAKLLRFLQERMIDRVGAIEPISVDVRVICATHRNLNHLIESGEFREDLYYRISEITLDVPALRDRDGDALVLAVSLLKSIGKELDRPHLSFAEDAINAVNNYPWPGNVREMINKVKRAIIMAEGKRVTAEDLSLQPSSTQDEKCLNLRQIRETAERRALNQALQVSGFNMAKAARLLGITRPTIYSLTDKYNIETSEASPES